jgi:peptidase M28-like protein/PA domain-containing protein
VPRWLIAVVVVAVVAVVAFVAAGGDDGGGPRASRGGDAVGAHLRALQRAADEHGGTRAAGTAGDRATGEYIAEQLKTAGYRVSTETFQVPFYRELSPPKVVVGGRELKPIRTLQFSPSGSATGRIRPVGLGCAARDYRALRRGEIALARRGDCFFFLKAAAARRAGAAALLVANDAPPPTPGSLFRLGPGIPAVGIGRDAADGLAGKRATVAVDADSERRETTNVTGEIGPEDAPRVIMAGAHRDSVPAGPGMNDDGSGVVALLAIAARMRADELPPRSAFRVGFWGGEELGLLGSRRYVNGLSDAERRRIAAYLNLDMVASPGERVAVYDTDDRIEAVYRRHLPPDAPEVRLEGDSDHASFEAKDIPAGGIFTGLDDCYHQACDTIGNVDRRVLATSIAATEATIQELLER